MASLIEQYLAFFDGSPFMYTLAAVALLVVLSAILNFIVKKILLRLVNRALRLTPAANIGDNLIEKVIGPACQYRSRSRVHTGSLLDSEFAGRARFLYP